MYFFDENIEACRSPEGAVAFGTALRLRVKLLRAEAVGARLYYHRDGEHVYEAFLRFLCMDGAYDVFEYNLHFEQPGLYWYHFQVDKANGEAVRVPEAMGHELQVTVYASPKKQPDWINGGLIYHIFVDRFNRGPKLNLRAGAVYREDWGACPYYLPDEKGIVHNNDFFGGDLYGIIEKLPYLEQLGVTCIYLSPVFEAMSNHKYDTGDFMKIDKAFGGDKAFVKLCKEAKKVGIKVILDGVFNHVGADSVYFNRYNQYDTVGAYHGDDSPYRDWFHFKDDGTYESWWGIELLPALNKGNQQYIDYVCAKDGVIAHWTKKGVSGWRLDVVDELPDVFLQPLCDAIKREKKDALIVGEVWEDASNKIAYDVRRRYFNGDQLDSVTNYPLKNAIIAFVKDGDVKRIADVTASLCRNYPKHVLHSLMNIIGTHDTARILTVLGSEGLPHTKTEMEHFFLDAHQYELGKRRLRLASALQFTLPGVPCVYYGDEAGMQGGADPFNRRTYPWGNEDKELLNWYMSLSDMRKKYRCFTDGKYTALEARAGVFVFIRGEGDERVLVAINNSNEDKEIHVDGFNYSILDKCFTETLLVKAFDAGFYAIEERKGKK